MITKFKVGDKARIIQGGIGTHPEDVGKIVTITGINKNYGGVRQRNDVEYDTTGLEIDTISWGSHRYVGGNAAFEKVEQPKEQEMKQNFKKGDVVVINGKPGIWNGFAVGSTATVDYYDGKTAFGVDKYVLEGTLSNGRVGAQVLEVGQFDATLNFAAPLFTAEGTPVVLVTKTNPRDPKFPVLVYEGKAGVPTKYDLNGKAKNGVARRNLTNVVPKVEVAVTEKFVALLDPKTNPNGQQVAISLYDTAQKAREACAVNALRVGGKGPVGIAKVTLVSGRWPV